MTGDVGTIDPNSSRNITCIIYAGQRNYRLAASPLSRGGRNFSSAAVVSHPRCRFMRRVCCRRSPNASAGSCPRLCKIVIHRNVSACKRMPMAAPKALENFLSETAAFCHRAPFLSRSLRVPLTRSLSLSRSIGVTYIIYSITFI